MKSINIKKSNIIFTIVISLLCIGLFYSPTGFENPILTEFNLRVKGKVIYTKNEDIQKHGVVTVGTQKLKIVVLEGQFKGDTILSKNVLMGQLNIDRLYKPGDKVLTILRLNKEKNKIETGRADDIYRINVEIILFALFAGFLIIFAGIIGFKALLSFVFTALAMWKFLIPMFLSGNNPIIVSLIFVASSTSIIILLITGFTKKGYVALSGSIMGIVITSVMAIIFDYFFNIPGTVKEFSETLIYAGFGNLDLSKIFISAIFISAAGAVMDVAMDISASQNELIEKNPYLKRKELMHSGFNIAYPVIGTMTTTLLFAYSGSFIFVFMLFMAKGTPMISIFNKNFIAAEVLHTLIGSFGLVLVAPATAIIGSYIYTRTKKQG